MQSGGNRTRNLTVQKLMPRKMYKIEISSWKKAPMA